MAEAISVNLREQLKDAIKARRRNDAAFGRFPTVVSNDSVGEQDRCSRINEIMKHICKDAKIRQTDFNTHFEMDVASKSLKGQNSLVVLLHKLNLEIDEEALNVLCSTSKSSGTVEKPNDHNENRSNRQTTIKDNDQQTTGNLSLNIELPLSSLTITKQPDSERKGKNAEK